MRELELVIPTIEHEIQAREFIQEFVDNNSRINGTGDLDSSLNDYEGWLKNVRDFAKGINLPEGYVPGSTFFAIRKTDNKIVGMVNIRHELSEFLLRKGGHIGNCVRPTERRKGYGKEILYLGIEKCKELGIEKVLLVCDKENVASAKQIQSSFGVLENEILDKERTLQRYWIDVEYFLTNKEKIIVSRKKF